MRYWYCLTHRTVEPNEGCPDSERLGPYLTRAQAELALDRAKERTEFWDKDVRWNDEDEQ